MLTDEKQIELWQEKAHTLLVNFDFQAQQAQIEALQAQTNQTDFWQQVQAKKVMQTLSDLQTSIQVRRELQALLEELATILLVLDDKKEAQNNLYLAQKEQCFLNLKNLVQQLELEQYLRGPYDVYEAIFNLHAGQGGTEAMDWTGMLARAYTRYFDKKGYRYHLISESRGEEAGYKAISYEIKVKYAYGLLKYEAGTHRLVRLSPFNADNLRQTSFALVEILPSIPAEDQQIAFNEDDLSWHFSRSGGAGGQNVNKVNTAVELTYLPLNWVVKCREERSQEQNKQRALQILRAKLAQAREEKRLQEIRTLKGGKTQASWGTQIRNYVLHPYQLVKDVRTGVETSDTQGVLAGDLDDFINTALIKLSV